MSVKPETRRQRRIRKAIEGAFPLCWWVKIHGNEFMPSGLPDLIGTVDGLFFAFEVKEPDGTLADIQDETIDDIRKAGGIAAVVEEPWEAIALIHEARRLSAEGRHLFGGAGWVRAVLRAKNRKNMDKYRPLGIRKRTGSIVRSPVK